MIVKQVKFNLEIGCQDVKNGFLADCTSKSNGRKVVLDSFGNFNFLGGFYDVINDPLKLNLHAIYVTMH